MGESSEEAATMIPTLPEELRVDRKAEVPVGVQLAWALRARIGDGRLSPGERLPALREMAETTGLNVNTVRAVYQRLEGQGLVESQQGSGTFVAAAPQRPGAANAIAATAASEARELHIDPREVAAALYSRPDEASAPLDAERERRRLLRAQVAALERTVSELEAAHPGPAPAPGTRRGDGPTLLGAEQLEAVREELLKRLAAIQSAIDSPGAGRAARGAERRAAPAAAPARSPKPRPAPKAAAALPAGRHKPAKRPSTRPATASG